MKTAFLFQYMTIFGIYAEVHTIANGDNIISYINKTQALFRGKSRLISVSAYKTTKAADTDADNINNELIKGIRAQGLNPWEVVTW